MKTPRIRRKDIPEAFQEALGTHEAFRKLGYSADDIWVHLRDDGMMFVIVRPQGQPDFAVGVGKCAMTPEEWRVQWPALATAVSEGRVSPKDMNAMWVASVPFRHKVDFISALLMKGLSPPCMTDKNVDALRWGHG